MQEVFCQTIVPPNLRRTCCTSVLASSASDGGPDAPNGRKSASAALEEDDDDDDDDNMAMTEAKSRDLELRNSMKRKTNKRGSSRKSANGRPVTLKLLSKDEQEGGEQQGDQAETNNVALTEVKDSAAAAVVLECQGGSE